jgi:antitoxin component YwqK of YwqJK toxin-antitoxin module
MKPVFQITSIISIFMIVFLSCSQGHIKHETRTEDGKLLARWWETVKDGKTVKHGEVTKWYLNGQKYLEGVMVYGKGDGQWKKYYNNGQPWVQSSWEKGKFLGKITWWNDTGEKKEDFDLKEAEFGLVGHDGNIRMWQIKVDYDFFNKLELELLAGRTFARQMAADKTKTAIINDAAAKKIGRESHIGKRFKNGRVIIGVVSNIFEVDAPTIFTLSTEQ